uniref:Uncharacterized protein n=1 Tax=Anguilla anguilla TaxID=7936 RepID=A0A0E9TYV7_ANGAN
MNWKILIEQLEFQSVAGDVSEIKFQTAALNVQYLG